jgi:hypothetical protein
VSTFSSESVASAHLSATSVLGEESLTEASKPAPIFISGQNKKIVIKPTLAEKDSNWETSQVNLREKVHRVSWYLVFGGETASSCRRINENTIWR